MSVDINDLYYQLQDVKRILKNIERDTTKIENSTDDEMIYFRQKLDEIDRNVKALMAGQRK